MIPAPEGQQRYTPFTFECLSHACSRVKFVTALYVPTQTAGEHILLLYLDHQHIYRGEGQKNKRTGFQSSGMVDKNIRDLSYRVPQRRRMSTIAREWRSALFCDTFLNHGERYEPDDGDFSMVVYPTLILSLVQYKRDGNPGTQVAKQTFIHSSATSWPQYHAALPPHVVGATSHSLHIRPDSQVVSRDLGIRALGTYG